MTSSHIRGIVIVLCRCVFYDYNVHHADSAQTSRVCSRDRFRTQVNVWGDSVGAGIVEKLAGNQLDTLGDAIDNDATEKGEHNNGYTDDGHMHNTML